MKLSWDDCPCKTINKEHSVVFNMLDGFVAGMYGKRNEIGIIIWF